jgi:hypothetical protein
MRDAPQPISVPVAKGSWIARRDRNRRWEVLWAAQAVVWIGIAVYALVAKGHLHVPDRIGIAAFCLPFVIAFAVIARRCANAGLLIRDHEVVIRGPLKNWTVPIADAQGFIAGVQPGTGNGTPGVLLNVSTRRPIPIWTLAGDGLVWNFRRIAQSFDRTVDSLNQLLREAGDNG